jgi:hypothetical protein
MGIDPHRAHPLTWMEGRLPRPNGKLELDRSLQQKLLQAVFQEPRLLRRLPGVAASEGGFCRQS